MTTTTITASREWRTGNITLQASALLFGLSALLWAVLLARWLTFGLFAWTPWPVEVFLDAWPAGAAIALYVALLGVDILVILGGRRRRRWARHVGLARSVALVLLAVVYYALSRDLVMALVWLGLAGAQALVLWPSPPWALSWPAALWLGIFFMFPLFLMFVVSLGERSSTGTVVYTFTLQNYTRFFGRIGGRFLYLLIFWRSLWLGIVNTALCLLFGYPLALWIARQPERRRNTYLLLVMIPFWTNFLVRTYAWMVILRDTGVINTFIMDVLAWTDRPLRLLYTPGAVFLGLFYGYLPFMVLPLYASIERMDWSLVEAAQDLGASTWRVFWEVVRPLTMPGIVAGSILVFIPSVGAYVTPDLLGGAKVTMVGNLLQQQFLVVRDWPFGSAVGFILMILMLVATMVYFRTGGRTL